jgi:hypothetical protein
LIVLAHGLKEFGKDKEIKRVNFNFGYLDEMLKMYNLAKLKDGFNKAYEEKIFFISNPELR